MYGKHLIQQPTVEDIKFLKLAKFVAEEWSLDPSTKTGAVLVDERNNVVSIDCNRIPHGMDTSVIFKDRETKLKHIIHCEKAAANTAGNKTRGCKLYTWPFMSCSLCAAHMSDLGIVGNIAPYNENERWLGDFNMATNTYTQLGVEVKLIDISHLSF